MFKILILSPFRHVFRNKDIWLTAHEQYHLNPVKDKEELKYFLSDSFPYKQYVYFDKEKLGKALLQEAAEESGFTPYGPPEEEVEQEKIHLPSHDAFTAPLQEAAINPFAEKEEAFKFRPKLIEPTSETEEDIQPPQMLTSNKLPEAEEFKPVVCIPDKEKNERKEQLGNLHWRKLKDISEGYGIEYTDKESVVKEIIQLEYN